MTPCIYGQHYMEIRMPPGQATLNSRTGWFNGPVAADFEIWYDLVKAFGSHLWEKYGEEEMTGWHFEVWVRSTRQTSASAKFGSFSGIVIPPFGLTFGQM